MYDPTTYVNFRNRSAGPGGSGAHIYDQQAGSWSATEIGRSKVCTIEPLVARTDTVASPNGASPLACNLNGVLTAPLRGTVSFVAVCDATPAGRSRTSSLTSPLKPFNETRSMLLES